jgi:hypothetical protein
METPNALDDPMFYLSSAKALPKRGDGIGEIAATR